MCAVFRHRRQEPDPRTFIGGGKVRELMAEVEAHEIGLVLVDHALTPAQERNLEADLQCRVLDRTGLILDIFAQRAQSFEGRLQVELAQLRHIASRLVRGWSHLERQKGGIGLRGPGETQLEMDRRLLGGRIKQVERRLEKVRRSREEGRKARRRRELPVVALVGYTNAGKSTLFNALTGSERLAQDQLFATLDTSWRRMELPTGAAVLADTVGFISRLPHDLVAAFRSTLEEVSDADLLVHVVDASAEERVSQVEEVDAVLREIGAADVPTLRVYNKVDLCTRTTGVEWAEDGMGEAGLRISAARSEGLDALRARIGQILGPRRLRRRVRLAPEQGRLRSRLFQSGRVLSEALTEAGALEFEVELSDRELERLYLHEGLDRSEVVTP